MKKLIVTTLLTSLINVNCYAEDSVVLLEKGGTAPYKGYLFSEDKALKIRKELIELDGLRLIEQSYTRSIDLYKKNEEARVNQVQLLLDRNDKLAESLAKSHERSEWENRIWFAMGIIVTGVAVYGAGQLSR